jgi:hypothetical protein
MIITFGCEVRPMTAEPPWIVARVSIGPDGRRRTRFCQHVHRSERAVMKCARAMAKGWAHGDTSSHVEIRTRPASHRWWNGAAGAEAEMAYGLDLAERMGVTE